MAALEAGDCAGALEQLNDIPEDKRQPMWYALAAHAHGTCPVSNRQERAIAVIEEGLERHPESLDLIWTHGEMLLTFDREEEANLKFREAHDIAEDRLASGKAHANEADIIARYRRWNAAPGRADLRLLNQAAEQLAKNECSRAIEILTTTDQRYTEQHYVLLTQAYLDCWFSSGDDEHMRNVLLTAREGAEAFPGSSRLPARIAEVWTYSGRQDLALKHLQEAREIALRNLQSLTDESELQREQVQLKLLNQRIKDLKASVD
jgi:tetratricopeptide (TPR) repeat protein